MHHLLEIQVVGEIRQFDGDDGLLAVGLHGQVQLADVLLRVVQPQFDDGVLRALVIEVEGEKTVVGPVDDLVCVIRKVADDGGPQVHAFLPLGIGEADGVLLWLHFAFDVAEFPVGRDGLRIEFAEIDVFRGGADAADQHGRAAE